MQKQGSSFSGLFYLFMGVVLLFFYVYYNIFVNWKLLGALANEEMGDFLIYILLLAVLLSGGIICSVLAAMNFHGSGLRMPTLSDIRPQAETFDCISCKGEIFAEDRYCRWCGRKTLETPVPAPPLNTHAKYDDKQVINEITQQIEQNRSSEEKDSIYDCCPHCGKQNHENRLICPSCGTYLHMSSSEKRPPRNVRY